VEATAIGNVLMQAIGMNDLGSLEEAREVARRSFEPEIYEPQQAAAWDESYIRFQRLIK
jgi:rhamnulokinase